MQSTRQSTVQLILNGKLEDIAKQHVALLATMACRISKAEDSVKKWASAEVQSTEAALRLAMYMDQILDKLTTCYEAISSVDEVAVKQSELAAIENQHEGSDVRSAVHTDAAAVVNILQVQVESLQQQVSVLLESHDGNFSTRLQNVEAQVLAMNEEQGSSNKFNSIGERLQNVEAKMLLIEEMQLRNDERVMNATTEMSKLRADIIELQDDTNRLDLQQDMLGERFQDLEKTTDGLVKLRETLNHLHMKVAKRDELSGNVTQLQEEITKVYCELEQATLPKTLEGAVQDKEQMMPAFVAAAKSDTFRPFQKILFSDVVLNDCGGYDPKTSVFQAPVKGVYLFGVSISTNSEGLFTAAIMHNERMVALFGASGKKDEQTGTSVFLNLSLGDKVWIEVEHQSSITGVVVGGGFSNFIGCRLR